MDTNLFYFMRRQPVDLLRYLPRFLSKDKTFKNISDTLSWEHENLRLKLVDITKQFFLETSTWGLSDWERFLAITPSEGQTFEERKAVARTKLRGADTMTVENTLRLMREFMSSGEPGIEELGDCEIKLILDNGVYNWKELFQALFEYLPAHLDFSFKVNLHYEDELYIGIPAASIDEQIIDGAGAENFGNAISLGIVLQDSSANTIDYDKSDLDCRVHNINIAFVFREWEQLNIAADNPADDDFDEEFSKLLWERWWKWKHNPLVKIYDHHFDDDEEGEIDPDDPNEPFPFGRDFLRLYWKFPYTKRLRAITILNPRKDIRGADVNFVGNYAAANELLIDSRGFTTLGIKRALIVTKTIENIFGGTGDAGYIHPPKGDNGKFKPQKK